MTTSTLIFTAIPNPTESAAGLRLTVLVSPRLEARMASGLRLDQFEIGTVPWPSRVAAMTLGVRFDGGPMLPAQLAPPARPVEARDPAMWQALFPGDTPVAPYVFQDDRWRKLRSFPAAHIHERLLDLYRDTAQSSPHSYPRLDPGAASPGKLDRFTFSLGTLPDLLDELAFQDYEDACILDRTETEYQRPHYDALRFYTRRPLRLPSADDPPPPPPPIPELDFHRMVSVLADHPTLLRKLGLAFEVIVPGVSLAALPTRGTVQLHAEWRGPSSADKFPRMHYDTSSGSFQPAPRDPTFCDGGYLRLDRADRFPVMVLDIDGAALKVVDFAVAVRKALTDPQQPPIADTSLPALRTGGFTITHAERSAWVEQQIGRGATLNGNLDNVELWAEDVVRGYRIDVHSNGAWYSLCRRWGAIRVGELAPLPIPEAQEEEGYVKAASAASNERANELYLHEAIAGWDGFSLSARRPGKALVFTGDPEHPDEVRTVGNTPGPNIDVRTEYRPTRRSLPQLRFGRSYRLRARLVDLSGSGLPHTDPAEESATSEHLYQRYEPVASPVLVLRSPITEGESLELMVIRSTPGMTPEEYVASGPVRGARYPSRNERHVLPPKTSQAMAETHGMFDPAFTSTALAQVYYRVALKEEGTLLDREIIDIRTGTKIAVKALRLHNPSGVHTDQPLAWPARRGDPLLPGQYVTHGGEEVRIPYLPDPLAAGLALFEPALPEAVVQRTYPVLPGPWPAGLADWPEKQSLRVILRGTTGNAIVRDASGGDPRTVIFEVPQGHKHTLRYSSLIPQARLPEMAVWNLLGPASQMVHERLVLAGKHWMLTPYRELTLVHAVQRPVTPPRLVTTLARNPGETFVRFEGHIDCHGWSTSHIDIRASWADPIDLPSEPAPRMVTHAAEAFRVPVAYAETSVAVPRTAPVQERALRISPAGIPYLHVTTTPQTRSGLHEFGDTKHHSVTYRPVGTTRYREYFPAELIASPANLESLGEEPWVASARASTRPEKPQVLYIVPTFAWETATNGKRTRRGGGLRIYLDRGWFSSGREERLGILLAPYPWRYLERLKPFISLWGRDPIWSAPAPDALSLEHVAGLGEKTHWFPELDGDPEVDRLVVAEAVRLYEPGRTAEEVQQEVRVLGVVPAFHAERQLWYCDLEFDPQRGYFPFIRLALARYQPNAITTPELSLELSETVLAEFAQIAPDRAATLVVSPDSVLVQLWGITAGNGLEQLGSPPEGPSNAGAAHRVRARIERRDGGDQAGDLAWRLVSGPVDLPATWNDETTGEATWAGSVPLPRQEGREEYRVVLVESEIYDTDPPGMLATRERVSYLDALKIVR
ncbi:hypothetical protein WME75_09425 [Sorangium sp. So ce1014]|uniref:hypothetical protein n=1 Tax=Sorangium sp. So ce1014 TaxID=3133326 RepID=UPI003F61D0E0